MTYLALLRGINVGGKNVIKMADLKKLFEEEGYQHVQTYIQSGNVIFTSPETDQAQLTEKIEQMLASAFSYHGKIVLVSRDELEQVISDMPSLWHSEDLRCYISFVRPPSLPEEIAKEMKLTATDTLTEGKGVLYMATRADGLTDSGFSKGSGTKWYQEITIRNLATCEKLLELMKDVRAE